jgi:hypothetical protein
MQRLLRYQSHTTIMISTETTRETPDAVVVRVKVKEGSSETSHEVTVPRKDLARLGRPNEEASAFVSRCFEFLLEREPKESIMSRFEVMVIARYFPEFEREIVR